MFKYLDKLNEHDRIKKRAICGEISKPVDIEYGLMIPEGELGDKKFPICVFLPSAGMGSFLDCNITDRLNKIKELYYYIQICYDKDYVDIDGVKDAIDVTLRENPNADPKRIYLIGFSLGARIQYQCLINHQNYYAGALIMAGVADPHRGWRIDCNTWQFHGSQDTVVSPEESRNMFHELKSRDSKLSILKNTGHNSIWVLESEQVLKWLFSQKRQ